MPVIKAPKPNIPATKPPVQIAKQEYKSIQVDSRVNPRQGIIAQMEGSPWTLKKYYSQVLRKDSGAAGQGLGTDPQFQQYTCIVNLEIRVTTPLSDNQNQETKEMEQTGEANQYSFIIPNTGDMFTADLLDGRLGIFEVTSSTRPTTEMDAAYGMGYKLVGINDTVRERDLESKVVKEVYFEKSFIKHGQNPLLVSDEYECYNYIRRQYYSLIRRFFDRFTSKEHATIIVPDQPTPTYDHFITLLMYRMVDSTEDYRIRDLRRLNMDDDQLMGSRSVWDMLIERDRSLSFDIFTQAGLADTSSFTRFPRHDGIRYSGVKKVVYPADAPLKSDVGVTETPKSAGEWDPYIETGRNKRVIDYLEKVKETLPSTNGRVMAHPVMQGGYYVFSKAFYESDNSENAQSQLELCLQDLIDNRHISFERVKELVEHLSVSKDIDLFYYIPALLVIIRGVIRSL